MSLNFSPSCPNKVDCSSKKDTIIEASNWEAKKPVHGIMVAMTSVIYSLWYYYVISFQIGWKTVITNDQVTQIIKFHSAF